MANSHAGLRRSGVGSVDCACLLPPGKFGRGLADHLWTRDGGKLGSRELATPSALTGTVTHLGVFLSSTDDQLDSVSETCDEIPVPVLVGPQAVLEAYAGNLYVRPPHISRFRN